jgi:ubiquinone/menaquinone biosynthesis C-methylase UbiE
MGDLTNNAEDLGPADEMEVIDKLVPVAGLNVLDVGCGNGRIAR